MRVRIAGVALAVVLALAVSQGVARADSGGAVAHIVYFYSVDCPHCQTVIDEVLTPLQAKYGDQLEIKMIEISDPDNYEMLVRAEEMFGVAPEERALPTLIAGGQVLIGEDAIREQLACLLDTCLSNGGTSWPSIPGLADVPAGGEGGGLSTGLGGGGQPIGACPSDPAQEDVCRDLPAIRVAYFYQVGCRECDRAEHDIEYIKSRYPQVVVDEFNIFDSVGLAEWLAGRVGRSTDLRAPAVFVGDDVLIGPAEVTPQNLELLVQKYAATGTQPIWSDYQPTTNTGSALRLGTIALAGMVDGLNPCAFATLIFFVSYLTVSGRRGWQVLAVGGAFTFGVFVAYLAIGLGLYKILDAVRSQHATWARGVYALTGLLCLVLAAFSFADFLKARRGKVKDMALVLPEGLRRRINAVIRNTSGTRAFVGIALLTGMAISLLELACTGQVYFATLVSMVNMPGTQAQALPLLLLYCLMFSVPLVIVFLLVYFGTSSLQLGLFLRRHTATVKLATGLLFVAFAGWLIASLASQLL